MAEAFDSDTPGPQHSSNGGHPEEHEEHEEAAPAEHGQAELQFPTAWLEVLQEETGVDPERDARLLQWAQGSGYDGEHLLAVARELVADWRRDRRGRKNLHTAFRSKVRVTSASDVAAGAQRPSGRVSAEGQSDAAVAVADAVLQSFVLLPELEGVPTVVVPSLIPADAAVPERGRGYPAPLQHGVMTRVSQRLLQRPPAYKRLVVRPVARWESIPPHEAAQYPQAFWLERRGMVRWAKQRVIVALPVQDRFGRELHVPVPVDALGGRWADRVMDDTPQRLAVALSPQHLLAVYQQDVLARQFSARAPRMSRIRFGLFVALAAGLAGILFLLVISGLDILGS